MHCHFVHPTFLHASCEHCSAKNNNVAEKQNKTFIIGLFLTLVDKVYILNDKFKKLNKLS